MIFIRYNTALLEISISIRRSCTVLRLLQITRDATFVRIFVFTWAEWLDVMEFKIHDGKVEVGIK
jgi:hypothetical protein